MLTLPLLNFLRGSRGQSIIHKLVTMSSESPFLFFVPAISFITLLPPLWIAGRSPFYYGFMFIVGFILASDARFGAILHHQRKPFLLLGFSLLVLPAVLYAAGVVPPNNLLLDAVRYVGASWYLQLALLSYARHYLTVAHPLTGYWNEAGMPFYILHQPVIIVSGYFLIHLPFSVEALFVLTTAISFVASLLLYHLLIRRSPVLRFLFGMRRSKKQSLSSIKPLL